jgi:ABC-type nitrate/sulfonate/bicarbonate transport system substrate-binding protein
MIRPSWQEEMIVDRLRINSFGRLAAHEAAVAKGFYAAEDLEVEHTATTASKTQMGELKDGVWNFVHTHPDNVFWWNEDNGADLLIVMALPAEPNLILVVAPEIKSYEDLRGKTIAADAAESGFVTSLRVLLKENGLTDEGRDYRFEEIGASRAEALAAGRYLASMLNTGGERALLDKGFHVLDSIKHLYTNYAVIATARRPWVLENREIVVRYLRAHMRALLWLDDPANTTELAQFPHRPGPNRAHAPTHVRMGGLATDDADPAGRWLATRRRRPSPLRRRLVLCRGDQGL